MNGFSPEVIVPCVGAALLLFFAIRLRRRVHSADDFILGRRRVEARLGAIGIALSGAPLWWLLLVAASAYTDGRSALWIALAILGGVIVTGWAIAPRLRSRAQMQQSNTIVQLLAGDAGEKMHGMLMRSAALIVAIALMLLLVAQLQLLADVFANALATSSVLIIVAVVLLVGIALLLAGLWSALIADVLQLLLIALIGASACVALLTHHSTPASWSAGAWFAGQSGLLSVSLLMGVGFLIGDGMGQSSLLTRFMACKDDSDLMVARRRAVLYALALLALALLVGWLARAFSGADRIATNTLMEWAARTFSERGAMLWMILIAMSFALATSNGLIAVASHLANDVRRGGATVTLSRCRIGLAIAATCAAGLAIYLPTTTVEGNFARMLFSWHALGAAFGPLVIVRLTGKRVRPGSMLGAMWSGFLLTVVFHLLPDTTGDLLERSLPFTTSLGIALSGGERRRNPDRADRGDRTIHDRLPI